MGFWKKTFWAFIQTPEEKAKLAEFVENKKQELDREAEIDIAQYRDRCAQQVADLQNYSAEELRRIRDSQFAKIDGSSQVQDLLEKGIIDQTFVDDFKTKLQKMSKK